MDVIEPWDGEPFGGAKLALIHGTELLTYLRDDRPDIPYPNHWDLPGGGREGDESPTDCALRELYEEFGLRLGTDCLTAGRRFSKSMDGPLPSYFFLGRITPQQIDAIVFGDEGQRWRMMPLMEFLFHDQAVPALQERLLALSQASGRVVSTSPDES